MKPHCIQGGAAVSLLMEYRILLSPAQGTGRGSSPPSLSPFPVLGLER